MRPLLKELDDSGYSTNSVRESNNLRDSCALFIKELDDTGYSTSCIKESDTRVESRKKRGDQHRADPLFNFFASKNPT